MAILNVDKSASHFNVWDINPFLLASIFPISFILIVTFGSKKWRHHKIVELLMIGAVMLLAIQIPAILILEHYFWDECPIDPQSHALTQDLMWTVLKALQNMEIETVVACGTLLSVARKQTMPWDTDADFLVEYPSDINAFLKRLRRELPFVDEISHPLGRDLIQIEAGSAHIDIFPFRKQMSASNQLILFNNDRTTHPQSVPYEYVFPSKYTLWLGRKIPIPNDVHRLALLQFDESYMTPYFNRFQCSENLLTVKASVGRLTIYILVFFVTTAIVSWHLLSIYFKWKRSNNAIHRYKAIPSKPNTIVTITGRPQQEVTRRNKEEHFS